MNNCLALSLAAVLLAPGLVLAQGGESVLFIGNSFTFGQGSAVRYYRPETVTDLNNSGQGGMPALFKAFAAQAGLDYDVYLETQPGSGLEFHIDNKLGTIARRGWDTVVMHGQSTLDFEKPGDPAKLVATTRQLAEVLQTRNPAVRIHLLATWARADQSYPDTGAWTGKPIATMAQDVRAAYDAAAAASGAIVSVIPVGEAWNRAMMAGVADPNPYDGIAFGQLDLWTYDHYHASAYGSYLEALVVFGSLTGRDPRALGAHECAAYELGFSQAQVRALQQVAFEELETAGLVQSAPLTLANPPAAERCVHGG